MAKGTINLADDGATSTTPDSRSETMVEDLPYALKAGSSLTLKGSAKTVNGTPGSFEIRKGTHVFLADEVFASLDERRQPRRLSSRACPTGTRARGSTRSPESTPAPRLPHPSRRVRPLSRPMPSSLPTTPVCRPLSLPGPRSSRWGSPSADGAWQTVAEQHQYRENSTRPARGQYPARGGNLGYRTRVSTLTARSLTLRSPESWLPCLP